MYQKKPLTEAVDKLKKAIESDRTPEIKAAVDNVQKLFSDAMAAAKSAGFNPEDFAGGGAGPESGPAAEAAGSKAGPKKAKGTVIDAEAEVVDE